MRIQIFMILVFSAILFSGCAPQAEGSRYLIEDHSPYRSSSNLYLSSSNYLPPGDMAVIDGELVIRGSFMSEEGKIDSLKIIRNPYDPTIFSKGWLKHSEHSILLTVGK